MLGTARLLGQTTGAAIVALLFARLPLQGPVVALFMATGFALIAACVSVARLYEPLGQSQLSAPNPEADPTLHGAVLRERQAERPTIH
jgi:hypothetical protein